MLHATPSIVRIVAEDGGDCWQGAVHARCRQRKSGRELQVVGSVGVGVYTCVSVFDLPHVQCEEAQQNNEHINPSPVEPPEAGASPDWSKHASPSLKTLSRR